MIYELYLYYIEELYLKPPPSRGEEASSRERIFIYGEYEIGSTTFTPSGIKM